MKFRGILSTAAAAAAATLLCASGGAWAQVTCTPTGFFVDGMNMTAAEINPGDVTGPLDAAGCNIGVYYDDTGSGGTVSNANIAGANYFGVVVNGQGATSPLNVNITNSSIHDIGDTPQSGAQHGNAIFYINGTAASGIDGSRTCTSGNTTGTVSGNAVTTYQKNGITAKCPGVTVTVSDNTVTGAGKVDYIAQNGIEVGAGATGSVSGNTVSANQYTGANGASSSGVLVFGGGFFGAVSSKVQVVNNVLTSNDVGVFSFNCGDQDCTGIAPSDDTDNLISGNILSNADISNVSGCGGTQGYQAAVSELGRNDKIKQNKISGAGYTPNGVACTGTGTTPAIFSIDRSARQGPNQ